MFFGDNFQSAFLSECIENVLTVMEEGFTLQHICDGFQDVLCENFHDTFSDIF